MANSTCSSFPKNPQHCDELVAVRRAFGSISLVACLFVIFVIWLFKRYVAFSQRLILYMSIAACFECVSFLMAGGDNDGSFCDFQGWFMTLFSWMVLLWVTCITLNLSMNVIKLRTTEKYERWLIGICTLFPLGISLLPFFGDHYGPSGAWCWLKPNTGWRMGIWYGPLFITLTGLAITYTYIIYSLNRKASNWHGTYDPDTDREYRLLKEDIITLRLYPFIYIATMVFPLINRIQNAVSPENHVFALVLLASITSPMNGMLNALVFGLTKETFQRLRPEQMKLAFLSKLAPRSVVQEYPQPDADTNALHTSNAAHHQMDIDMCVNPSS